MMVLLLYGAAAAWCRIDRQCDWNCGHTSDCNRMNRYWVVEENDVCHEFLDSLRTKKNEDIDSSDTYTTARSSWTSMDQFSPKTFQRIVSCVVIALRNNAIGRSS